MARVRYETESDDELPDLDEIISKHLRRPAVDGRPAAFIHISVQAPKTERVPAKRSPEKRLPEKRLPEKGSEDGAASPDRTRSSEQCSALFTSRLSPPASKSDSRKLKPLGGTFRSLQSTAEQPKTRTSPQRKAKRALNYGLRADREVDSSEESTLEESVFCASGDSGEESEPERSEPELLSRSPGKELPKIERRERNPRFSFNPPSRLEFASAGPGTESPQRLKEQHTKDAGISSSDQEDDRFSTLRLSPGSRSQAKRPSTPTPPPSPTKSRLVSPSKRKPRIPTPPHRSSIDAFWKADTVNDWNDSYSPQKLLLSPRKTRSLDDAATSPTSSPRKPQSPSKCSRAEIDARKDFESNKHRTAAAFLSELDATITSGQIEAMTASTGGVKMIWSKTLNSTAGRANWKRETHRHRSADGGTTTTHSHHASIELAEKVIDDTSRLLNVLAHEFCHLANFILSGVKDQPHGASFKAWGRACSVAFAARGVHVTTKHSYAIDYKYAWACLDDACGAQFQRHSKSIDPLRHACGRCRARLVQVRPVPRGAGAGGGYAAFVKEHFASVRKEMPAGARHKEVMEALGRRYREQKGTAAGNETAIKTVEKADGDDGVESMAKAFEVVVLDG